MTLIASAREPQHNKTRVPAMPTNIRATKWRLPALLARLVRDRRGVAAIEFAYIAPILLVILMATFEFSRAISIDRRLNAVSASASEVVAREDEITSSDLDKIAEAMRHVMEPYDDGSLVVRLIGVRASSTNAADTKVEWSYQYANGSSSTPLAQCANYALENGLVNKNGSVIVAEVGYDYTPVFANFITTRLNFSALQSRPNSTGIPRNWTSKAIHAPRKSCVDYNNTNCVLNCGS